MHEEDDMQPSGFEGRGGALVEEARKMMNGTTLRPPRMKEWMFPTPTTQETEHKNIELTKTGRRISKDGKNTHSLSLADTVQMFPTPTARDYKDRGQNTNYEKAKKKGKLAGAVGGTLNPTWVEWLMGYPIGYLDSVPWETRSSLRSSKK